MEDTFNYFKNAPGDFSLCLKSGCATVNECLRGLAGRDLDRERLNLSVVNPLLADEKGGEACPFFRKEEKVRIAYGFKRAKAKVEAGQVRNLRSAICRWVCQRDYYYLLKGEKPISPEMQKKITAVLARCGAPEPIEFDRYEWKYLW